VTVNGLDFKSNFATLQVVKPNIAVAIKPMFLFSAGGSRIEFSLLPGGTRSNILICKFLVDKETVASVPARFLSEAEAECISPSLPLGAGSGNEYLFAIEQAGMNIFGPISVEVSQSPSLSAVAPTLLVSGKVTPVLVRFYRPTIISQLYCDFGGSFYKMKFVNSTTGMCALQPILSGQSTMTVRHYQLSSGIAIGNVTIDVVDAPVDIQLNVTALL